MNTWPNDIYIEEAAAAIRGIEVLEREMKYLRWLAEAVSLFVDNSTMPSPDPNQHRRAFLCMVERLNHLRHVRKPTEADPGDETKRETI